MLTLDLMKLPLNLLARHDKSSGANERGWQRSALTGRLLSLSAPASGQLMGDQFQRAVPTQPDEACNTTPSLTVVRPLRKLMSYNAENFNKLNGGNNQKAQEKIKALAEVIEKESPDVIALQEVGDKALLEAFNKQYLKGAYPNVVSHWIPNRGSMQVALMSRKGIDIADSKSHWKEMCADNQCAGKRDFLEATFKTNTGYQFTVFNAHLKSMRGDEAQTAPLRMQDAKTAATILKKFLASKPKAHVLVTGDFNALHQTPLGKPVIDTILYLKQAPDLTQDQPVFSEVFLKDGKSDPTESSKGRFPDAKLDYTFTSKALTPQVKQAYVAGRFDQEPWSKASDHLPVITVFEEDKPQARGLSATGKGQAASKPKRGSKRKLELIV